MKWAKYGTRKTREYEQDFTLIGNINFIKIIFHETK